MSDPHWKATKTKEIDKLILYCTGLYLEAVADTYSKTEGDSLNIKLELINRSPLAVMVKSISAAEIDYQTANPVQLTNNKKQSWKLI